MSCYLQILKSTLNKASLYGGGLWRHGQESLVFDQYDVPGYMPSFSGFFNFIFSYFFHPCLKSQVKKVLICSDLGTSSAEERCFNSDSALFITWESLNTADSALISAKNLNFQSTLSFSKTTLHYAAFSKIQNYNFCWKNLRLLWDGGNTLISFHNPKRREQINILVAQSAYGPNYEFSSYTVKLARAKLHANAGNFTCSSQVKRSLAQFTCVTCSLPVITGKFTCFEAASTSRRTHANCLRAHVNLPEYHRHFTGSFTCGTHANLTATSMQNCLLLQAKIHATYRQKHWNRR